MLEVIQKSLVRDKSGVPEVDEHSFPPNRTTTIQRRLLEIVFIGKRNKLWIPISLRSRKIRIIDKMLRIPQVLKQFLNSLNIFVQLRYIFILSESQFLFCQINKIVHFFLKKAIRIKYSILPQVPYYTYDNKFWGKFSFLFS